MHGLVAIIAIIFALVMPSPALAQKPVDFGGEWWSQRCAQVSLAENGSRLSGRYTPTSGPAAGQALEVIGFRTGVDLIAFAVNFGPIGPIAAWSGQHTIQLGGEVMVTSWLMTTDVPDEEEEKELYKSIWSGADTFARVRPAHCK